MTQTPAGWFPDPHDVTQLRYWDGTTWTEHRSPRGPSPVDQVNPADQATQATQATVDLSTGPGPERGLGTAGSWAGQSPATAPAGQPTFASVAGACRDEPARQPLSVTTHLVLGPTDVAGVARFFAQTSTPVTPEWGTLANEHARLVPNPWNPTDPHGVAVFVGPLQVGRLPADLEVSYCAPLALLTSRGLLATCVAELWAQGPGTVAAAGVTVRLPEVAALA